MLNTILIIIGVLFALFILIFICSACVISSRSDKFMEEYQSDISCGNEDRLKGLENATLERLLELYEEGGVNFIINDGKVVDYEVE